MARPNKNRVVAEAVVSAAAGGGWSLVLLKLIPQRWHWRMLVLAVIALVALGVVRLHWSDNAPGVDIDLKHTAELEHDAEKLLKAARDRLQQKR